VKAIFRVLVNVGLHNPLRFRFDPLSQQLFIEWLSELEAKVRGNELHPALISHLSKYRSLMPSLALLFELADRAAAGELTFDADNLLVSLEHTRQAAAFCAYLESHAHRIYSCVTTPQMRAAQELAEKIRTGKAGATGIFTCRDVYLKGWTCLDTPEAVRLAAHILLDAGWIRELSADPGTSGGRPSLRYRVNPRISK
jgi:putative DNA primase/helicase